MEKETWRDKLRPASFRGVPFWVDDASNEIGRKVVVHEYPQRDDAYVEDLGRLTRSYRFSAFVIGDDCFEQRDKLLDALEAKGAGTLVHPWLGSLTVKVGQCSVKHSRTEGGYIKFDLMFYPSTELPVPTATTNTAQVIREDGRAFHKSASKRFLETMQSLTPSNISVQLLGQTLTNAFETASDYIEGVSEVVTDVAGFVDLAVNNPKALVGVVLDKTAAAYGFTGALNKVQKGFWSSVSAINSLSASIDGLSDDRDRAQTGGIDTAMASNAVIGLVQDSLMLQMAGEASLLPVVQPAPEERVTATVEQQALQPVRLPEVPVADDVISARDRSVDTVWRASESAEAEHFIRLNKLRQSSAKHLTEVAKAGVNLIEIEVPEVTPAVVLAWAQWQDSNRQSEIVQRNGVKNPLFVTSDKILVADK